MSTLYVSDLDGTLLNSKVELSTYTLDTIRELTNSGLLFTFATARSLTGALKKVSTLPVTLPAIVYNGAFIRDVKTGNAIRSCFFNDRQKEEIFEIILRHGATPIVYSYHNDSERVSYIGSKLNDGMNVYVNNRKGDMRLRDVNSVEELFSGNVFYFTCIGTQEEMAPLNEEIVATGKYTSVYDKNIYRDDYWCEIMPKEATKAQAVQSLKEIYKCDRVVSFGDALNDRSIFEVSDECYAVENAHPYLKEIATAVIPSNDCDGVAKTLRKLTGLSD